MIENNKRIIEKEYFYRENKKIKKSQKYKTSTRRMRKKQHGPFEIKDFLTPLRCNQKLDFAFFFFRDDTVPLGDMSPPK